MIHIFNLQSSNVNPNSNRPDWFGPNGYEKCFKNLLDTTNWNLAKLYIVFDGNSDGHFINKYKDKYPFEIFHINSNKDMFRSNTLMYEYIKSQNISQDDLIYTLEWDYLHIPNWTNIVLDAYESNPFYNTENLFLSCYFHPDKVYFRHKNRNDHWGLYNNLKSEFYITNYSYIMEVPSTCNSFLMKKSLFNKEYDILSLPEADNVRFPKLLNKGNKVFQFCPGISTHLDRIYLTPFIPWQKIMENIKLL